MVEKEPIIKEESEEIIQEISSEEPPILKKNFWKSALSFGLEIFKTVIISLAIILPIRYFVIQPFMVDGASMEPNFSDKQYLVINEISSI